MFESAFHFLPEWVRGTRHAAVAVLAFLLLLGSTIAAPGQAVDTGSITGRVTEGSGEPLQGVSITLLSTAGRVVRVIATDSTGGFRLAALPAGAYLLRAALLGRAPVQYDVTVGAGAAVQLDLRMEVAVFEIEGVEVHAPRDRGRERSRFDEEAGATARVVGGEELRRVPGLAEADVLRVVELLPGVVSTSDFSSAFNVRGGSADQNLILLDGFPVFNPFHLGGLFSVFNADVVARAELLAGGFGAEHGGRVSSVLNVESVLPSDTSGLRAAGGVSLLASRLALQSGLPRGLGTALGGTGGSWFVAARRSYFDVLLKPVYDFPYHLTDTQGQLSIGTPNEGRLRFTFYSGDDVLDLSGLEATEENDRSVLRIGWRWGNDVFGAHWRQPTRGGWVTDTHVGFSRYRDGLAFVDFDDTRFSSRISQLFARSEATRELGSFSVRAGAEIGRLRYVNHAEAGGAEFLSSADEGTGGSAFVAGQWRPTAPWIVDGGMRLDAWHPYATSVTTLSPRLAAKRFFGDERNVAMKLAVGRYTQFLHSLRNEELPLSNDLWIAAGMDVPHVSSDQVQAGIEAFLPHDWFFSAEAYARRFRGIVEFNPVDDPNDPSDDLLTGEGLSRGLDFQLRKRSGRASGWATLSLLHAERRLPDPAELGLMTEHPAEIRYPPHWDRRVNFHAVVFGELPRRLEGSLRWTFGSGLPYTRPRAQHLGWEYNLERARYRVPTRPFGDDEPSLFVVLGERNAERYPAYHRLDATLRRTFHPRGATVTPYVQVLNLYNRRNVLYYFYNFDRSPPTRSGISMFPVLPTIGAEVVF